MTKFRTTLIALAMASTSFLGAASASSGPVSLKIVAFGSSSTQGIGASGPSAAYPAQLQVALKRMIPQDRNVAVINRGIGGEDADDMVKRLQKDVIDRHPDLVIFQTGSNDPMRHVPLARFERETRDSIKAMQAAGIMVMLMEPQWCPMLDKTAGSLDYRDVVRKIGADMNVAVIRRSDLMHDWVEKGILTKHQMLASDGLHMRDKGYALLANTVATEVLKIGTFKALARPDVGQQAGL